jgi:BirA family biotin operon repressor/biotin-[acetyl-CoA-carboxylase] ligase
MTPDASEKTVLVTLSRGLFPHAEPLVCDDLRAIFGASSEQPEAPDMLGILDVPVSTFIAGKCTSSFALAWDLFEDGALMEWGGVLCACQSDGRGQLRRHWHSPRGNLYVSFLLPRDLLLMRDAAALVTGYILLTALRTLGYSLSLKWPNDLLLHESDKIGGLLLEERDGILMAGLGINLAEAPPAAELRGQSATRAAVLAEFTGENREPIAPFALWRRLVSELILTYTRHVQGRSLPELLDKIDGVLAWKNRAVICSEGDEYALRGKLLGLGPGGGLLLQLPNREKREVFSGSLFLA